MSQSERIPVNPILNGCRCRGPKKHRDCSYCGVGWDDGKVCGVCRENGVDGKVIQGTSRRVCSAHKDPVLRAPCAARPTVRKRRTLPRPVRKPRPPVGRRR